MGRWEKPDRKPVIFETTGRKIPLTAANSSMFLTLVRDMTSSLRTKSVWVIDLAVSHF